LTSHGQVLQKRARPLLQDLAALESLARQLQQGWESELRLVVDAAFPRKRLLRIVAELQRLCPQTQLKLSDAVLSFTDTATTENLADVVVTTKVPSGTLGQWLLD